MIRHGGRWALLGGVFLAAAVGAPAGPAIGGFTDDAAVVGSFANDTLDPPTGPTAVGGYGAVITWTPSVDPYATGYLVLRGTSPGGPYTVVGTTAGTAASFTDLASPGDYVYVVRTSYAGWTSVDSQEVAAGVDTGPTDPASCGAGAAETGGDGDGYEAGRASACGDDGVFARDVNSGTNATTSCTNGGKDRHRFSGFGLDVPASASRVEGIEVAADAYVSAVTGTNRLCAQLSWDAGASWTAPKQVDLTGSETARAFGSPTDTWGRPWSPSELDDVSFRVRLVSVANALNRTFFLDDVRVVVTWTR